MRLSIKGIAIASGLLWGAAILLVGLINLSRPAYGMNFLTMMSSVYPWFHHARTLGSVVTGAVEGVIDGAVAGVLFAWLYNSMLDLSSKANTLQGRHV